MTNKPLPPQAKARVRDVLAREQAARPAETGRDIVRRPLDGMDERFGYAADSRYLKD